MIQYIHGGPFYGTHSNFSVGKTDTEKIVQIKLVQDNGSHLSNLMNLTLRSIFKVIWRSELFFLMGPPTFDTGFEESGKFYVRNILKFFILTLRRSNQVFKKRSEAVYLNAFILLLALPRNNDVNVVSFVSFGVFVVPRTRHGARCLTERALRWEGRRCFW